MLFNSLAFAIYLPLVFILYYKWFNHEIKTRNIFLLLVSYIFYGWWDYRFLALIIVSSLIDYFAALNIQKSHSKPLQKLWLAISLTGNLGILCLFKYYSFFTASLSHLLSPLGIHLSYFTINITLPVGISFYTFQTLSYTIDVYKQKIKPTHDWVAFFTYVAFFPQLVAGPIERARNLLPQFYSLHFFHFKPGVDALKRISWGFLKKMVIADTCAVFIEPVFNNPSEYGSLMLLTAAVLFTIQIYGDFSGYSDIAIGTAQLFGFKLMENFKTPYFSTTVAEFWRRWHISLTTWFRDYLYYPLGGSKKGKTRTLFNVFVVFIVSGLWHGANYTFIAWGLFIVASYYIDMLTGQVKISSAHFSDNRLLPSAKDMIKMLYVFMVYAFSMIFFRSANIIQAYVYYKTMFTKALWHNPHGFAAEIGYQITQFSILLIFIGLMFLFEWKNRNKRHVADTSSYSPAIRFIILIAVIISILLFGQFNQNSFVYFQF